MKRLFTIFFILSLGVVLGGFYLVISFNTEKLESMNGTIEKSFFRDKLVAERHYSNDKLNGITKIFYNSGSLKSQFNFRDGMKDGAAIHYTPEGNIRYRDQYEMGKKVSRKEYSESGELVAEKKFES